MERKTFDYKLEDKDRELLKLADKASQLDTLMTNIKYYTKQDEDKGVKEELLNSAVKVFTMEDLLYKYRRYEPEYSSTTRVFTFNKALPMEVYTLFRRDSARFKFSDFIIVGEDADAGYRKFN